MGHAILLGYFFIIYQYHRIEYQRIHYLHGFLYYLLFLYAKIISDYQKFSIFFMDNDPCTTLLKSFPYS
jgi:hypothetical protein